MVSFWGGTVSSSSSPGRAAGEEKFFVFFPLFLPLPPTCSVRAKTRCHPPHDEKAEKSCPASDTPIGHLSRHRDRAGELCAPCAAMGRGRVDPAPPAPINTVSKGEEEGRRKKRGDRKREIAVSFLEERGPRKRNSKVFRETRGKKKNMGDIDREERFREKQTVPPRKLKQQKTQRE